MNIQIRKELPKDYRRVEEITREAFWNLFVPGCDEHYLAHVVRGHDDFLEDYSIVAFDSENDIVVATIMYTKSKVESEEGNIVETLTFGPISVLPEYQNKGIGSKLIKATIDKAKSDKIPAIVIEGHPKNYCKHGFKGSFDFNLSDVDGRFPFGLLVLELQEDVFVGKEWKYFRSPAYDVDSKLVQEFDKGFPEKAKAYKPSQEEFAMACKAFILDV